MTSVLDTIAITRAKPDDLDLVRDSWAHSYRKATWFEGQHRRSNRTMPTDAFHTWHRPIREGILERRPLILVARDVDDPSFLYGWACAEVNANLYPDRFVLHYGYTKLTFQRQGIFRLLLGTALDVLGDDMPRGYTHHTIMDRYLDRRGFRYVRP